MNEFLLVDRRDWLITFLASFMIWIMFAGLLVLWLIDGKIKKEEAIHAFLAATGAWLIAEMIKNLIPSVRPFEINGYSPLTLTIPSNNAFPSSHCAAVFGMAFAVWQHDKKLGMVFLVGATLVGVGRVLANVHYPFDVFGGALIGFVVAIVAKRLHVRT